MKIEYIKGNLVTTDIRLIAHGCNAQGKMGKGVAKAIRDRWPANYTQYAKRHAQFGLKLGEVIPVVVEGKTILNCITQERYGTDSTIRYVNYAAMVKCFLQIHSMYCKTDQYIALPRIGASLGGGDWNIIEQLIEDSFVRMIPVVYV